MFYFFHSFLFLNIVDIAFDIDNRSDCEKQWWRKDANWNSDRWSKQTYRNSILWNLGFSDLSRFYNKVPKVV